MTTGPGYGIAVAALATTSYNVGLIFEKRALRRMPAIDARHAFALLRTVLLDGAWVIGFALMACGLGLQVVALTLAPISVVQPVLGSGVVILVVLSAIVLRERLGALELSCVIAVVVAIAAIALSAAVAGAQVGHRTSGWLVAAVSIPTCVVALAVGASALGPPPRAKHRIPAIGVSYGLAAGLLYGVATLALKALSGAVFQLPGGLRELTVVVLTSPYPYLTVACSAVALLIFQTGLQRCRVSIVGPVSNITGSAFFLVAGTWLFGERLPATPGALALRLGGILAAGLAVIVLSRQPSGTDRLPGAAGDGLARQRAATTVGAPPTEDATAAGAA
jgi:drug/metabolite transporter (DMT)-like permease